MSWGITDKQSDEILEFISDNFYCGIIAPTGSGKSTKIIQNLYEKGGNPRIFISEPTIPSATQLHRYMSSVMGKEKVGWAAEGEVRYTSSTPIVYCTSGHLRRKMLSYFVNGEVKSGIIDFCDVIVIDEAHNGSIDNAAIIELWLAAQRQDATTPMLILASATLTKESSIIENLPTYQIKTKSRHIELEYAPKDYAADAKALYTDLAINIMLKHNEIPIPENDYSKWLVFCAGEGEVNQVCDLLRAGEFEDMIIKPFHSKVTPEEMAKIDEVPDMNKRIIVVSTNIGEASLTLQNLDGVFDSMTEKVGETSSAGGSRLVVKHISKSSAAQRKGRTGRTHEGFCYRMCTEKFFNTLPEQRESEITRMPITNLLIEFLNVGLDPMEIFKAQVSEVKLMNTMKDLVNLKLIDKKGNVTELGEFSTMLPLGVKNSALIYNWMQDPNKYPLYPIVVLAVLMDSYGPSYYFYPRKAEGQSAGEYDKFKQDYHREYFGKYDSDNDLKSLLLMWNDMMKSFKNLTPGKDEVLEWCKTHNLNNKKISEVLKEVYRTCGKIMTITPEPRVPINVGDFNIDNFLKIARKYLSQVYSRNTYNLVKDGVYVDPESNKYFRIDYRQGINPKLRPTQKKIIAIRTAEIVSSSKGSSNVISLYYPL